MNIHVIPGYQYDSNIYVIDGENPTIIDTGTGLYHEKVIKQISSFIDIKQIKQIILTHEHYDHAGGVKKLYDLTGGAEIIAHEFASKKIEKGESLFARMLGGEMPRMPVDIQLIGGETLQIGNEMFQVFSTPGHTPGCICLYSKTSKTLFSGDTVFAHGSYGRYDFPGGNLSQLKESLRLLHSLDVKDLYPGHESIVIGDANKHISLSLQNIGDF
jgi:hydroxyacylglutathione hydrolase